MSKEWWKESAKGLPELITEIPVRKSKVIHANTARYMKGLSGRWTNIVIGPQSFIPTAALESHENGRRISLS